MNEFKTKNETLSERCPNCRRRQFEISYAEAIPVALKCSNVSCELELTLVSAQPTSTTSRKDEQIWEVVYQRKDTSSEEKFTFLVPGP